MGKIFCLMGKSSSGKDTVYRMLLDDPALNLKNIVPYTTRPIRLGEHEGKEYHFVDRERLEELEKSGRVVEKRIYNTCHGEWAYFTVDDGSIEPGSQNYLVIGTVDSYMHLRDFFGGDRVCPIYMEVDDGIRLQRALTREMGEKEPRYSEMCRRFLADNQDFSEERLAAAGITRRFSNDSLGETIKNISEYIRREQEEEA